MGSGVKAMVVAVLWAAFGCQVEFDHAGSEFRCSQRSPSCPGAATCVRDRCVDVEAGLLLHWAFDETDGSAVADSSGNGRDGVAEGVTFAPGRFGNALACDGLGGTVSEPAAADYLAGLSGFTMLVWVKSDLVGTDSGFVTGSFPVMGDTSDGRGISLRYDLNGSDGLGINVLKAGVSAGGAVQELESASERQSSEWQHVALTWESGGSLGLFLDSVPGMPSALEPSVSGSVDDLDLLVVGKGAKDIESSWSGLIDDLRIYDGVLSESAIRAIAGL